MSMTDPISDLLTRVRNGMMAKHDTVDVPASRMKVEIVKILKDEGYIDDFSVREQERQGVITVQLKYQGDGSRSIIGLQRVSRPGRRVYCTGSSCRKLGVGGEVLCNVW
jgi:small subunit ribosomal protein S8